MRLIDANAALRKVEQIPFIVNENKAFHEGCRYMQKKVLRIFHESKSIEAEVVRHGRWEEMHYEGGILDGTNFDRCSVCGYERCFDDPAFKTVFKYCPNCGARMDLEG